MAAAMLCTSAAAGDLKGMQRVLESEGVTVDDVNSDGRSALHCAASEGQMAAVKMLLAAGAKLDIEDRWGGTPLVDALRHRHLQVANLLLAEGARVHDTGSSHYKRSSAVLQACEAAARGNVDHLQVLACSADMPLNDGDYDGRTPLHLAASEGQLAAVEFLIAQNVDVNPTDRWGATPLQDALRHKHTECAIALLNHGALQGNELSSTARGTHRVLHAAAAAAAGNVQLLETYLKQPGASVDDSDYDSRTALHLAASEGRAETVAYLVEQAGADPNPVDRWGGTPLQDALRHKHLDVASILLLHGARTGQQLFSKDKLSNPRSRSLEPSVLRDLLLCPIRRTLMQKPVVAADGNSYEQEALEVWFAEHGAVSPVTKQPLPHTNFVINLALMEVQSKLTALDLEPALPVQAPLQAPKGLKPPTQSKPHSPLEMRSSRRGSPTSSSDAALPPMLARGAAAALGTWSHEDNSSYRHQWSGSQTPPRLSALRPNSRPSSGGVRGL